MPIEDVDYLKKNSVKQSYIFLVDSKDRNKESYPTPAEYIVDFSVPFQNVIGMNVVDASIPRTMYNVDAYNNTLQFFIHTSNYDLNSLSLQDFATATLETGDYTIQTLIVELNSKLQTYVNSNVSLPLASITASAVSNPPDIKNKIRFSCPYPFLFNMKDSTLSETLGFDAYNKETEYQKTPLNRNYDPYNLPTYPGITDSNVVTAYTLFKKGNSIQEVASLLGDDLALVTRIQPYAANFQLFHSTDVPFSDFSSNTALVTENTYTLFEGPRGVIRQESLEGKYLAQKFYVPTKTNLVKVYAGLYTDILSPSSIASFTIQKDLSGNPSGIPLTQGNIAVSYTDGSLSDSTNLALSLEADTYYWVVFQSNQDISIYYNDVLTTTEPFKSKTPPDTQWVSYDDIPNDIYFQLTMRVDVCNDYHQITAPGIYSLVGERYIVLRCKEIEENSFRSLAYTRHNLGIAKFRLGVVGYREERLDYSSVPNREFHPIGKLNRLTLRFETSTGKLYDFKDVNHTITFSVQYLEPTTKVEFTKSLINGNYNGDFMRYQYHQEEQEEDSDDQDMDYNRDAFERYKLNEARNLPFQVAQRDIKTYYNLNYPSDDSGEEDDTSD